MANKVIVRFRDKTSKEVYEKGDSYTHADKERVAYLVNRGYLEDNQSGEKTTNKTDGKTESKKTTKKIEEKTESKKTDKK